MYSVAEDTPTLHTCIPHIFIHAFAYKHKKGKAVCRFKNCRMKQNHIASKEVAGFSETVLGYGFKAMYVWCYYHGVPEIINLILTMA